MSTYFGAKAYNSRVDVKELKMNVVDQLASGYNSCQSAALLVGV